MKKRSRTGPTIRQGEEAMVYGVGAIALFYIGGSPYYF